MAKKEEERDTADKNLRDTVESIQIKHEGSSGDDEIRKKEEEEATKWLINFWMILRA